ncbi:hypothetical protein T11_4206 [Trichinella zimbabwensis]|uniref:Secreted protein n=1 Tax=Trichinella zimbabwensis TaxID=268475 RepID=A0A0V1GNG0_9BILA|nr:hypothetical protein T11_4206 [Trichinella zimbabwensis]
MQRARASLFFQALISLSSFCGQILSADNIKTVPSFQNSFNFKLPSRDSAVLRFAQRFLVHVVSVDSKLQTTSTNNKHTSNESAV